LISCLRCWLNLDIIYQICRDITFSLLIFNLISLIELYNLRLNMSLSSSVGWELKDVSYILVFYWSLLLLLEIRCDNSILWWTTTLIVHFILTATLSVLIKLSLLNNLLLLLLLESILLILYGQTILFSSWDNTTWVSCLSKSLLWTNLRNHWSYWKK